jgi:cytochrome c-type biogenesis protein CcmH/NrfG
MKYDLKAFESAVAAVKASIEGAAGRAAADGYRRLGEIYAQHGDHAAAAAAFRRADQLESERRQYLDAEANRG